MNNISHSILVKQAINISSDENKSLLKSTLTSYLNDSIKSHVHCSSNQLIIENGNLVSVEEDRYSHGSRSDDKHHIIRPATDADIHAVALLSLDL